MYVGYLCGRVRVRVRRRLQVRLRACAVRMRVLACLTCFICHSGFMYGEEMRGKCICICVHMRIRRVFEPPRQARRLDPIGAFVSHGIPFLVSQQAEDQVRSPFASQ